MRDPSFWNDTVPRALSTYAMVIFIMLWVGFAMTLAVNREWLDLLWNWVHITTEWLSPTAIDEERPGSSRSAGLSIGHRYSDLPLTCEVFR